MPTARHLREHTSQKTERQTTGEHGPGGNRQPGNYPGTCWSSVPSPGLAGHESAAAPECETDVGQGEDGGRALEIRRVLAFEGLFVAGICGSYPLGNRRRGRRDAAGRSRGPADAATPLSEWQEPRLEPGGYWGDALFANFESGFSCLDSFRSHSTKHAFGTANSSPLAAFSGLRQKCFLLPRGYPWPRGGSHSVHKGIFLLV